MEQGHAQWIRSLGPYEWSRPEHLTDLYSFAMHETATAALEGRREDVQAWATVAQAAAAGRTSWYASATYQDHTAARVEAYDLRDDRRPGKRLPDGPIGGGS